MDFELPIFAEHVDLTPIQLLFQKFSSRGGGRRNFFVLWGGEGLLLTCPRGGGVNLSWGSRRIWCIVGQGCPEGQGALTPCVSWGWRVWKKCGPPPLRIISRTALSSIEDIRHFHFMINYGHIQIAMVHTLHLLITTAYILSTQNSIPFRLVFWKLCEVPTCLIKPYNVIIVYTIVSTIDILCLISNTLHRSNKIQLDTFQVCRFISINNLALWTCM